MKRRGLFLGILAVALLAMPSRAGLDVAKLRPVQTLWVSVASEGIVLRTESGNVGVGADFAAALADMEAASASRIFYQTAEYLLVTREALTQIDQASKFLRPSCVLCLTEGEPVLDLAAQFLEEHGAKTTLQQHRADGRKLPVLMTREGRMNLVP